MSHRLNWSLMTGRSVLNDGDGIGMLSLDDEWCGLVVEACRRDDQGVRIRVTISIPTDEAEWIQDVACALCHQRLRVPPIPWLHPHEDHQPAMN